MSRSPTSNPSQDKEKADREARLAQALRTNLRRRKAPASAAAKPESSPQGDE
jgi:hypothetical protein